jgi:uncharacterized Zn finger protein (UPF0148 family)
MKGIRDRRVVGMASAFLSLAAVEAWARGGGGHSFSGGAHGGGGHGGGGGGGDAFFLIELILRLLFWLVFRHPLFGIPLVVGVTLVATLIYQRARTLPDFTVGARPAGLGSIQPPPIPVMAPRRTLEQLREAGSDPAFSLILFEDFLYALYARTQEARGAGRLDTLTPWLTGPTRADLASESAGLAAVQAVVVGAMRCLAAGGVAPPTPRVRARVEFEANYTEVRQDGTEQSYYVLERWDLLRSTTAVSRTPETATTFWCPSCGAPLDQLRGNLCGYCGKAVDTGEFDWLVERIEVVAKDPRPPQLTGTTEEEGTDLPTVVDPEAASRLALLQARDPAFAWDAFEARVRLVFQEFQTAWSERDLTRMRPWLTDSLFGAQAYWVEAYKRAHLVNRLGDPRVEAVTHARTSSDAYFDAITVRIAADGFDSTVTEDGRLVGGSASRRRRFTEYWTLIRGTGVQGAARADKSCPSCGAPLKINMAGQCEYCSSRVTSGIFDWVLSRIEQDETYTG